MEVLWNNFEAKFHALFMDTTERQDAFTALQNLQMKGDDVNTYISTFEHLQEKVGWE